MEDPFRTSFISYFDDLYKRVSTETGDWTVKGFIDVYQHIYTISLDTKVLSKVLEILMVPVIQHFADEQKYRLVFARAQNQYPDITLISLATDDYYAVDVKSTFRTGLDRQGQMKVNGMTLGTYGGYFRDRQSASISTFPYNRYAKHYVLGVVYTQIPELVEAHVYNISQLTQIPSVAKDFQFFLHEKFKVASDRPGSGNTKNIGSTVYLERLINGTGVFADLGIEVFDDYWMNYRNREMALREGFDRPPYTNLLEYKQYKGQGSAILNISDDHIQTEDQEL